MKKNEFKDLINYRYCGSNRENKMSCANRAAQFSQFAALTGYDSVLAESARETERRFDVDEERCDKINNCLSVILENFPKRTAAKIVYFIPDKKKTGGVYETVAGDVRWIDEGAMTVIFSDNSAVPIADIYDMEIIN